MPSKKLLIVMGAVTLAIGAMFVGGRLLNNVVTPLVAPEFLGRNECCH